LTCWPAIAAIAFLLLITVGAVALQIDCGQVGEDPDWPAIRAAFTAFLHGSANNESKEIVKTPGKSGCAARDLNPSPRIESPRIKELEERLCRWISPFPPRASPPAPLI
jgi:hypothetical protein